MNQKQHRIGSETQHLWKDASSVIRDRFLLDTAELPSVSLRSLDDDTSFGTMDEEGLCINISFPKLDELLSAIIAKFCLQASLPRDMLCSECIHDLSFEFARQQLDDITLKRRWVEVWAEHSPRQKISTVITYDPVEAYTWLYSLVGERGLTLIVRELTQRVRNQIRLTFEDYLLYFVRRSHAFANALTATELKIVSLLLERSGISFTEVAASTGLTKAWISRKASELRRRKILRRFERIPFSKVGIQMSHLLLKTDDVDEDEYSFLEKCPFLYSFRRVVSGAWTSFATLCIPFNADSLYRMKKGLRLIREMDIAVEQFKIHSSGVSYCFDHYDVGTGRWEIPWELLATQLRRIERDDLARAIPRVDVPLLGTIPELDELDMRIFDCIRKGVVSSTKIREHLKVGQNKLLKRLHDLREKGFLQETWEVHNIGLTEHCIIQTSDRETARTVAGWARRLPRCVISFSQEEELLLLADLPKGGSYGLASALEEVSSVVQVGDLSTKLYGSWGFPVALWDYEFKKWKCPKEELEEWISALS